MRPVPRSHGFARTARRSGLARLSRGPPRGVHPANPPRAGRQQGYAGSDGCAGGPVPGTFTGSRPGEDGAHGTSSRRIRRTRSGWSSPSGPGGPVRAAQAWRSTASTGRPPSPRSSARSTSPGRCSQALRSGRINHAYLFSGPRGCGKTSSARILARSLNCVQGPTPEPVRGVRLLRRAGAERAGQHRRHRDRRRLPRWRRRRPRPARARLLRAGGRALQGLHHRRGAHGHAAGLQRPAQAGRGAAAAPEVHLRHHRAGEGHPDHPVAHPPLPVPAGPAGHAARPAARTSCAGRASRSSPPCCRWWCAPAPARSATRCRSSTSSLAGADERGLTYARAVALLGFTDATLLDEIVDAFAGRRRRGLRRGRPGRRGRPRPAPVRRRPARPVPRPDRPRRGPRRRPRRGCSTLPPDRAGADGQAGRTVRRCRV